MYSAVHTYVVRTCLPCTLCLLVYEASAFHMEIKPGHTACDERLKSLSTVLCVISCYVMLCYVMLCYVVLCHVMSCYVMLCYIMLCHVM